MFAPWLVPTLAMWANSVPHTSLHNSYHIRHANIQPLAPAFLGKLQALTNISCRYHPLGFIRGVIGPTYPEYGFSDNHQCYYRYRRVPRSLSCHSDSSVHLLSCGLHNLAILTHHLGSCDVVNAPSCCDRSRVNGHWDSNQFLNWSSPHCLLPDILWARHT